MGEHSHRRAVRFGELLNPDVVARLGVREVLQKPLLGAAIVTAVRKALAS